MTLPGLHRRGGREPRPLPPIGPSSAAAWRAASWPRRSASLFPRDPLLPPRAAARQPLRLRPAAAAAGGNVHLHRDPDRSAHHLQGQRADVLSPPAPRACRPRARGRAMSPGRSAPRPAGVVTSCASSRWAPALSCGACVTSRGWWPRRRRHGCVLRPAGGAGGVQPPDRRGRSAAGRPRFRCRYAPDAVRVTLPGRRRRPRDRRAGRLDAIVADRSRLRRLRAASCSSELDGRSRARDRRLATATRPRRRSVPLPVGAGRPMGSRRRSTASTRRPMPTGAAAAGGRPTGARAGAALEELRARPAQPKRTADRRGLGEAARLPSPRRRAVSARPPRVEARTRLLIQDRAPEVIAIVERRPTWR